VRPAGEEGTARKAESDLDKAIDKNLEVKLLELNLNHDVRYNVKNGVVTLKGDVPSESKRASVQKLASDIPSVKQVVNELEVRNQKATSTKR
jgi:osmotically-inducible protein OsmY